MRVCLLVPELGASGGVAVAVRYAQALGADVVTSAADASGHYDVAVATWWRTAEDAWRVDADHRVLFVQGPDPFFYPQEEGFHRLAATLPLQLPFHVIAVSDWLARVIEAIRPGTN